MKKISVIILVTLFITTLSTARAEDQGVIQKNKFFEIMKVYSENDFVLNDTLEFAMFDMSAITFIDDNMPDNHISNNTNTSPQTQATNESAPDDLDNKNNEPPTKNGVPTEATQETTKKEPGDSDAVSEVKTILTKMPKMFFSNLKNQVILQGVPITLYSPKSPSYSKPLQYFVKIKRIHFQPQENGKAGATVQPISLRIYGEIRDKKSGEILFKYYDSAATSFVITGNQAERAINSLANALMKNFALFLKTKY